MTPRLLPHIACAMLLLFPLATTTYAQSRGRDDQPRRSGPGTGNPDEGHVPWKFVGGDVLQQQQPITLYWLPASLKEAEQSRLMLSRPLLMAAGRCVDLEIVLPERVAVIEKLGAAGKLPAALIVDRRGNVTRRAANVGVDAVERMLEQELSDRDDEMYSHLSEANHAVAAGNNASAISLYKSIWDDRCLFPLAGNDAQRALKTLGVTVDDTPPPAPADPNLKPPATSPASP
ncbi:MAG: hypothetical protein QOI24_1851 [Acidobacteriota bacterium]|jgi:hypothetical protein|nr:hypothetical protein [Acidobacteriota bacterium]